jgi:hypothetical protein
MRMRSIIGICLTLSVHCPVYALAHGAAPAAFDAHAGLNDSLQLIQTNIGLIHLQDGEYRYICPAQWGEEEKMYAGQLQENGDLIIPVNGAFYRGNGCEFERFEIRGWDGGYGGHHGGVVLERHEFGSRLWQISDAATLLVAEPRRIDSIFSDGSSVVYGGTMPTPWLARLVDGESTEVPIPDIPSGDYLSVRSADPIWFAVTRGERTGLYGVNQRATRLHISSERALHGPIQLNGGWLALVDGRLHFKSDSVNSSFALLGPNPNVSWTCLVTIGGTPHTCLDRGLARLSLAGDTIEAQSVFSLNQILPPKPICPSAAALQTQCQRQWLHYAAEAGLVRRDAGVQWMPDDSGPVASVGDASHDDSGDGHPPGSTSNGCAAWSAAQKGGSLGVPFMLMFGLVGYRYLAHARKRGCT